LVVLEGYEEGPPRVSVVVLEGYEEGPPRVSGEHPHGRKHSRTTCGAYTLT
jgi:hypothetical protein